MPIRKPAKSVFDVEAEEKQPKEDKRIQAKEFVAERQPNGLYAIKLTAGGEAPDVLKGFYTTGGRAEQAARSYLLSKHAPAAD